MASASLLPREMMEFQLSQIELLLAMYPSEENTSIDSYTQLIFSQLREWTEDTTRSPPPSIPSSVTIPLGLSLDEHETTTTTRSIILNIKVPLILEHGNSTDPPPLTVQVREASWMNKNQIAEITSTMPRDDVLSAIEHIREESIKYCNDPNKDQQQQQRQQQSDLISPLTTKTTVTPPISRIWFYFPSLSTRSKRDDLVTHAPHYNLTGFVLAGKPGLLCLEGTSSSVDAYMKFIKTESWGDIPPHQKKVSERYREHGDQVTRVFDDMTEITNLLGEKRGERANRGDMKALEAWLTSKGLGGAFQKVLI